jgi:hypothetical protein
MTADAKRRGNEVSAKQFEEKAHDYRRQADILRKTAVDGIP